MATYGDGSPGGSVSANVCFLIDMAIMGESPWTYGPAGLASEFLQQQPFIDVEQDIMIDQDE